MSSKVPNTIFIILGNSYQIVTAHLTRLDQFQYFGTCELRIEMSAFAILEYNCSKKRRPKTPNE